MKLNLVTFKEVQYNGLFFLVEFIDHSRDWPTLHKSRCWVIESVKEDFEGMKDPCFTTGYEACCYNCCALYIPYA